MSSYQGIRIVGGIMPPSFLSRVQSGEVDPESLTPASYRLAGNETIRDAAARAWTYLRNAWSAWHEIEVPGAGATRDRWLLPLLRELGYGNVPALSHGISIEGTSYPISHEWEHIPIQLLGPAVHLDRRNPGVAGAARAPQAMVQEALNKTDENLWAILSNGSTLRLLRDSSALAGSAYLEFDLDTIFDGDLYAEFLMLFLIAHSTRLEKRGGSDAGPADCWLEIWRNEAVDTGTRALDKLRVGVEQALVDLGDGFLHHSSNGWLVQALRSGELSDRDYLRALLRLVYRLLFMFVAEDRNALLDPEASTQQRATYTNYFSAARLRRMSRIRSGGPHPDLWQAQRMILSALGGNGLADVAIPALGGLFDPDPRAKLTQGQTEPDLLLSAELSNHALLSAVRNLSWVEVKGGRIQPVDYRNLGAEELGSVYESLLELIPRVDLADMSFRLETTAGNDRKTTGSYYTPSALVSALLDTALNPLLDDAIKGAKSPENAEQRLLALTVCDPACGSGGFLVAAARRIARRLAQVRSDEDEPTPETVQHALRDVVGHCIYGVDLNDLAAELAKVSLWLEAMEPGKPLGFLDARIRVGNSLLGTTPALMAEGIPDVAFKEIEGDNKKYAAAIRKQNKAERAGQSSLFAVDNSIPTDQFIHEREGLLVSSDSIEVTRKQARAWEEYESSDALRHARLQADAWCSAFVWPLHPGAVPPVTEDVFQTISTAPDAPNLEDQRAEINQLSHEYRFFHWHLEFPEVFGDLSAPNLGPDGWPGGFSSMLGNPPWEHIELKEQEYFESRVPEIASAAGAKRKRLITQLQLTDEVVYDRYLHDKRHIDGIRSFASLSGRYPLTGRGRVKTDSIFAELWRSTTSPHGRSGIIVPTGIATDATTQFFFKDLVTTESLASLYDFENAAPIFEGVHRSFKFCLLTMSGRLEQEPAASFAFFLHNAGQIDTHRFTLSPEEITLLNPNTGTCPIFRTRRDADITLGIYRRVPVLINEAKVEAGDPDGNPWGVSFKQGLFNMMSDSHLFHTREKLEAEGWHLVGNVFERDGKRMLPLYEAKMLHQFDNRWATYDGTAVRDVTDAEKSDSNFVALPRYWVADLEVTESLGDGSARQWLMGWRKLTNATNVRTLVGYKFPIGGLGDSGNLILNAEEPWLLDLILASIPLDFVARQKLGGTNFNFFQFEQLPTLRVQDLGFPWTLEPLEDALSFCKVRSLELTYFAWDMEPFAEDLDDVDVSGRVNPPFVWDPERRFLLRAELDAAFFHLYGVERDDVDYIMDTFPIVRRKDEAEYGEYRTKRVILEMFDAMQEAIDTRVAYQTPIDPPPGHGPRHPQRSS